MDTCKQPASLTNTMKSPQIRIQPLNDRDYNSIKRATASGTPESSDQKRKAIQDYWAAPRTSELTARLPAAPRISARLRPAN